MVFGVLACPAVMNNSDRHWVEEVELLAPRPLRHQEPGVLEHAQVLHDPKARHRERGFKFGQCLPVASEEPIEQEASRSIGKRFEYDIVITHAADYM
jgi:hypothetical protein